MLFLDIIGLTCCSSDNWDHIIHVHVFQRLSVHDFPRPPKRVLELGCGTGIWVIDAAKQWKVSCCSLRALQDTGLIH